MGSDAPGTGPGAKREKSVIVIAGTWNLNLLRKKTENPVINIVFFRL